MKTGLSISIASLLALSVPSLVEAQNLFISDFITGCIYEFTPSGAQSTFASGLNFPGALAFDSSGNLFVTTGGNLGNAVNIVEITPSGTQSTFASGLGITTSLVFNSAGDLFAAEESGGNVYEFTPSGAQSTFASGFGSLGGMAFDSAGNLFVTSTYVGNFPPAHIYEITPNGTQTIFASGVNGFWGLAFQDITLPVPEPSAWVMLGMGGLALFGLRRKV